MIRTLTLPATHHRFPVSSYKEAVFVRVAGDGESEVTGAVALDVSAEARDETPWTRTGFAEEAYGFESDWLAAPQSVVRICSSIGQKCFT